MKIENPQVANSTKPLLNLSLKLKKIAKVLFLLMATIITTALIVFSALFFYTQSDHFSKNFSKLIQNQINNKIVGKMEWSDLELSPFKGECFFNHYRLSLNGDEIISIDKFHINLDIPKMVNHIKSLTILTDIKNHIKEFDISNIANFSKMDDILKRVNVSNIIKNLLINGIIIKNITIEQPLIKLAITPDNKLNIVSAIPILEQNSKSEKKEKQFNLPFAIIIDNFNLKHGIFSYKSTIIEDINFAGSAKFKDKDSSEVNLSLSMKSQKIELNSHEKIESNNIHETQSNKFQIIQLDKHKKGIFSLNSAIFGKLNDPLLSCQISFINGHIMGRNITKATIDFAMDKKEIKIKSLEVGYFDAVLKANGNISFAKIFPKDFFGEHKKSLSESINIDKKNISINENQLKQETRISKQKIKVENITTNLHIIGNNIDIGKLIDTQYQSTSYIAKSKLKSNLYDKSPSEYAHQNNSKTKEIKGVCSFKADISGSLNDPEIKLTLEAQNAGYQGYPLVNSGDFDLMLSKGFLNIKKFDISSCDSLVKLDGTISYPKNFKIHEQKPIFNLSASSSKLNIVEVLKQFNILKNSAKQNIIAILQAKATLDGTLDNPNISLNADGNNIQLMGQTIGSASIKGGYQNHKTTIDYLALEFPLNTSITTTNPTITNTTATNPIIYTTTKKPATNTIASASDKFNINTNNKNIHFINSNVIQAKGFIAHNQKHKFKVDISSQGVELTFIEFINKAGVIKGVASGSVDIEGSLNALKSLIVKGDLALREVKIVNKPFQDFTAKVELKDNRLNINGKLNFDFNANFDFKSKDFIIHGIFNKTELMPWFTFAGVNNQIDGGIVTGTVDIKGNTKNLDKSILENISGKYSLSQLSLKPFLINEKVSIKADNINGWISGKEFRVEKFKTLLPENGDIVLSASGHIGGDIKAQAHATLPVKFASIFIPNMPDIKGIVKLNLNADITPTTYMQSDYSIKKENYSQFVPYTKPSYTQYSGYIKSNNNRLYMKHSKIDATIELLNIGVTLPLMSSSENSSDDSGSMELHSINGTIIADINKIEIPEITGKISKSGQFKLSGGANLINLIPENINAKLTAKAIPVNIIEDFTASFDTDLNFKGDFLKKELIGSFKDEIIKEEPNTFKSSSLLSGNIFINNAQWIRDIHVEKTILSTLTNSIIDKKKVRKKVKQKNIKIQDNNTSNSDRQTLIDKIVETMKLNIAIKGKKPFIVDNNLAYLEIHPDIKIGGSVLSPLISGRSEINPGTINYQSTEFTLTRGIINFVNPYKVEPELDIQSQRKIRDWNITLAISGTPDSIDFKLTSNPKLEDGDIISLLLRGKTVTELISAEGGTTLSAAGMLSQIAASAVSNKVKSATGLDIFEVGFGNSAGKSSSSKNRLGSSVSRSTSTVNGVNSRDDNGFDDINVTVGKELTDRISVKYGTENKDGIIVGKTSAEYKFTDNISVSGFQDSEGQFGGEVRYRLEFK